MKNWKQKIESWLFESAEEPAVQVKEEPVKQPVKVEEEPVIEEIEVVKEPVIEEVKSAFLKVDEPVVQEVKTIEVINKPEPTITRKEYHSRPVISPIFGSSSVETSDKYTTDTNTYENKASVMGTVFSPIHGKNTEESKNLVFEKKEMVDIKVDDILDNVKKAEKAAELEKTIEEIVENPAVKQNESIIKQINEVQANNNASTYGTLTEEEMRLVAQKQQKLTQTNIISSEDMSINTYSIYPEKIEKVQKKEDKDEQISLF